MSGTVWADALRQEHRRGRHGDTLFATGREPEIDVRETELDMPLQESFTDTVAVTPVMARRGAVGLLVGRAITIATTAVVQRSGNRRGAGDIDPLPAMERAEQDAQNQDRACHATHHRRSLIRLMT